MIPYLEIQSLQKAYGRKYILDDLSLTINAEETVAVTGPSGCGKSTLLNILGLLETYDAGSILLEGSEYPGLSSRGARNMRRNNINYLFQSFALIDSMTVRDNLMLALYYTGLNKAKKIAAIEDMLEKLSIRDKLDSKVNELSGGEKQRVAICRAMLKPGSLVLADEPTGSLDARMAHIVMDTLISSAHDKKKTLIVVTHDLAMAEKCDRVLCMNHGKLESLQR